jgi:hypothetical protein
LTVEKNKIMSKEEFLADDLFNKEHYEGLMISMGEDGRYQIGIQLDEDKVVKVDSATPETVRERIDYWRMHMYDFKSQYGVHDDQGEDAYGSSR